MFTRKQWSRQERGGIVRSYQLLASLLVLMAVLHGGARTQATEYTFIDLNPPGVPSSVANGASSGQVVGASEGGFGALLWSGSAESVVYLNPSGYTGSGANGTSGGFQVGWGDTGAGWHALLWSGSAESAVDLHPAGYTDSWANAVSGGTQAGVGHPAGESNAHALLWRGTASSVVDLNPTWLGWGYSEALAADGDVQVGVSATDRYGYVRAVLWSGSAESMVVLPTGGFPITAANGVRGGQIVGSGSEPYGASSYLAHALLWAGNLIDLTPTGFEAVALATNGSQQVGSGIRLDDWPRAHALVWSGSAGSCIDLNYFLPSGYTGSEARGIDEEGRIVGRAFLQSGGYHAVMWVPGAMLLWTGEFGNSWDIGGTNNWSAAGAGRGYDEGDHVTFNDTGANMLPIAITATVNPRSVVVNNSVTNIAFDGVGSIAGRCGLTKNGSGTLTIATQNTYTGETHINAGMVILAAGGALGASAVKLGDTTDSADAALLIAGPFTVDRPITVQDDGSPSSSRTLGGTNTAGTAVFSGGITVAKDLMLTAAPGGDVRLAGALDNSAGRKVTKIGDGAVTVAGSQMHGVGAALVVSGGTVNLDSDAGSSSIFNLAVSATGASTANLGATQHLARLALAGGAKANLVAGHDKVLVAKALGIEEVGGVPTSLLDLADNDMVVQHAEGASDSTGAIRSWIASGYNGRKWDGNGIVSTSAADNASTYGLGYAQNGTLVNPFTTFDGQPVDSTSILVKYTYLGDLNLDGKVDDNDVTMLVLNYGTGWKPGRPAGPAYWQDGDVAKYDGKIDDNDVTALVLNYGAGWKPGMGGPLGGISAAVPEPATLALLALGGLAVLQRRRR